jgi:hypothetical protein
MDFRLYARVLWRFKVVVGAGLLLALTLAVFSMVRVSSKGLTYRQTQLWSATTRVGVTQHGFPEGRLFAVPDGVTTAEQQARSLGIPVADPNRFTTLAVYYAEYATSDVVRNLMLRDGPVTGQILATTVVVGDSRTILPLIDLTGVATSAEGAIQLSKRTSDALATYVRYQQRVNNVPESDRVILQKVVSPKKAAVYQPRSKTMPIVIFLAVMFATVGLAFLLENLRPRVRRMGESAEAEFQPAQRRTA